MTKLFKAVTDYDKLLLVVENNTLPTIQWWILSIILGGATATN